MARDIIVNHAGAAGPPLFEVSLGIEATVREWWSAPAQELGLPLIESIYEGGFSDEGVEFSGTQIEDLDAELDVLQDHWERSTTPEARSQFLQRLADFRAAIQVARSSAAKVYIS
jgi:hypothetical protein